MSRLSTPVSRREFGFVVGLSQPAALSVSLLGGCLREHRGAWRWEVEGGQQDRTGVLKGSPARSWSSVLLGPRPRGEPQVPPCPVRTELSALTPRSLITGWVGQPQRPDEEGGVGDARKVLGEPTWLQYSSSCTTEAAPRAPRAGETKP